MPHDGIELTRVLKARIERVFRAWTRPEVMARWFYPGDGWTCAVTSELSEGGRWEVVMTDAAGGSHLQFGVYREIDELTPGRRVRWTCIAHDMPSWVETTLDWRLKEAGGSTLVSFEHAGWADVGPAPVTQGWKHFLASLKSYVETGTGQPW